MGEPARGLATWEDLLDAPEDGRFTYEVLGGNLEALPHPLPQQGDAVLGLVVPICTGTRGARRLVAHSGDGRDAGPTRHWWLPDIAGWQRERMPAFPRTRPIEIVPDWVCEVLSPSHPQRDRVHKADLYLRAGIPHYWMLDAEGRTLEALTAREGAWVRAGAWTDGDCPRIPPFEAIELDVGGLFPPIEKDTP